MSMMHGTKLREVQKGKMAFYCSACQTGHFVVVDGTRGWTWNGDGNYPTFSPSVLVRSYGAPDGREMMTPDEEVEFQKMLNDEGMDSVYHSKFGKICHSFVEQGQIRYLTDCTHKFAGQTVPLPDW